MENKEDGYRAGGKRKFTWVKVLLILLICEKIVQHVAVTLAFYFNWKSIISTVKIDSTGLMFLGALAGVLFIVCLWGMVTQRKWARTLVIFLALFDIMGESVAQGRIDIAINVSFLVAILLLILALSTRREFMEIRQ